MQPNAPISLALIGSRMARGPGGCPIAWQVQAINYGRFQVCIPSIAAVRSSRAR